MFFRSLLIEATPYVRLFLRCVYGGMSHCHMIIIVCGPCHIPMALRVIQFSDQYVCLVMCFVMHVTLSYDSHHV